MPQTIYEDTNPRELSELLSEVHNGSAVLPEFQRSFVWDAPDVAGLLTSLMEGYPAGSILRVRNTDDYFEWRRFEGVSTPTATKPVFLVLDGQQRLTSLYQALYGAGDERFFVRVGLMLKGQSFEECVFWERAGKKRELRLRNVEVQFSELVLPLSFFCDPKADLAKWVNDAAISQINGDMAKFLEIQSALNNVVLPLKSAIASYKFPVVTLSDKTTAAAICTIFETLNRTGIKLTPFELLTARYFPKGVNLRQTWENSLKEFPLLEEYEVDPYTILQAITLSVSNPPTVRRSALMNLTHDNVDKKWSIMCAALSSGLEVLRSDCGAVSEKWIPYSSMLVTLAAVIADKPIDKGPAAGGRRSKLVRWFWGACFGQAYDVASNFQIEKDYSALRSWMDGGALPGSIAISFDASRLIEITPKQRAIYRTLMCSVVANGALDFHTGKKIDAKIMRSESVDDHHIFPLDFLGEENRKNPLPKFDCILNRTLIDGSTNKSIGGRAPSAYLSDIDTAQGHANVDAILVSHLIETGGSEASEKNGLAAMRADEYDDFLDARRASFARRIAVLLS